jgi:hypothetical protein
VLFKSQFGLASGANPEVDADCDGGVGALDFLVFKSRFGGAPGPSGLACAGTPPCPAP